MKPRWQIRRARRELSLLLAVGLAGAASSAWGADPLEKVTGTEQWRPPPIEDPEAEWDGWLKDRLRWRGALRELQLERSRNRRLARYLRFRGRRAPPAQRDRPARRRAPPVRRKERPAPAEQPEQAPAAPAKQPEQAPVAPAKPSPPPPVEGDEGVITVE